MSDSPPVTPPVATGSTMGDLMVWGAIVISVLNALAFGVALILAFIKGDVANLNLLIGAIVANTSTTIAFWLGSSAGSRRKTDLLAQR